MKLFFLALAFLFLALGAVGVLIPVLPTVPFLLISSACFAKSSTRFHNWFLGTKLYQENLANFVQSRSMTLKTKLCILLPVSAMLILSIILVPVLIMRIFIVCLILFKYYYFCFRIKTIRETIDR